MTAATRGEVAVLLRRYNPENHHITGPRGHRLRHQSATCRISIASLKRQNVILASKSANFG